MKKISSFLIISLTYLLSFTSDRIFTYSYQSNVLEKGQMDLETSNTLRFKKLDFYRAIDSRLEFEVGVGKNTQTAFYFNFSQDAKAVLNGADVTIEKSFDISFSNEWLHHFKNPVSDKIGVAAYGEFKIGLQEIELESKLILDKQINKFTTVGNIILEYEITKDFKNVSGKIKPMRKHELKLNFTYGASYEIGKGFNIGLEILSNNVFVVGEKLQHSTLFLGPTLAYKHDRFWLAATVMPQVIAFKGRSEGVKLDLDEFERIQTRLLFAYSF